MRFPFKCILISIMLTCEMLAGNLLFGQRLKRKYDFAYLDRKITGWVDSGYYHGASVAIFKSNQMIHRRFFGDYNLTTVAYIASAGKWLAAATIAAVVDEGKLHWDDRASQWIPELKGVKGQATLRQLLSHTAGYPDYQPQGNAPDNYQTLKESVAHLTNLPADTLPGFVLNMGGSPCRLRAAWPNWLQGKTGESIFQQKIAIPLQMGQTHFTPVSTTGGQNPMLGGGARASLMDYANFLNMISNDGVFRGKRILSLKAINEMQTDQVGRGQMNDPYVLDTRVSRRTDIYGLGEWREEVDGHNKAVLISSPSWAGAYPWVDKKNKVYGFFLARVANMKNGFNSFLASPVLPLLVRDVLAVANHPDVKHGYINTPDGTRLYYEETGTGEPLIFIHGHSFDRTEWEPQFFAMAQNYRVIRYDLRGYGWSSMPRQDQRALHADDLRALMDVLHITKAHIVGLSLGGFIVTDFLALYPQRLLSATAASGDFFNVPGPHNPWTKEQTELQLQKIKAYQANGVDAGKRAWFDQLTRRNGRDVETLRRPVWDMIYKWDAWQPQHLEPRFLLGNEAEERLKMSKIDVPVMVLTGDADSSRKSKLLQ